MVGIVSSQQDASQLIHGLILCVFASAPVWCVLKFEINSAYQENNGTKKLFSHKVECLSSLAAPCMDLIIQEPDALNYAYL